MFKNNNDEKRDSTPNMNIQLSTDMGVGRSKRGTIVSRKGIK